MRRTIFAPGEYYHLFNRGNNKQIIFDNDRDYCRLLFLIFILQFPDKIENINRLVTDDVLSLASNILELRKKIDSTPMVNVIAFCLMPNHFHLLIQELCKGGVTKYMHRLSTAYTKYINKKYTKVGHLFQGPFGSTHIQSNEQLLYTSAYIHLNTREIYQWKNKEHLYPWSSYQDYIIKNRFGSLLSSSIVLDQFENNTKYQTFVESTGAKEDVLSLA